MVSMTMLIVFCCLGTITAGKIASLADLNVKPYHSSRNLMHGSIRNRTMYVIQRNLMNVSRKCSWGGGVGMGVLEMLLFAREVGGKTYSRKLNATL